MKTRVIQWTHGSDSLGRAVAAMGVFDGVHLGHRTLILDCVNLAAECEVRSAVVTFDRDPEQIVMPDRHVPQLLTLEDKLDIIAELGVDDIVVLPFCVRMAQMTPERFLDDVLLAALAPVAVAVGEDFRFGRYGSGNVDTLRRFGKTHGFDVAAHQLIRLDGAPVSATRIRTAIREGDVALAARLLGRPHRVAGSVVRGRGEGSSVLGVPTANVTPTTWAALPADGVYAGWACVQAGHYPAAISVGIPPMYPEATHRLEAHLLDFDGDLIGAAITLEFGERLRGQRVFGSSDELATAIAADVNLAREITEGR